MLTNSNKDYWHPMYIYLLFSWCGHGYRIMKNGWNLADCHRVWTPPPQCGTPNINQPQLWYINLMKGQQFSSCIPLRWPSFHNVFPLCQKCPPGSSSSTLLWLFFTLCLGFFWLATPGCRGNGDIPTPHQYPYPHHPHLTPPSLISPNISCLACLIWSGRAHGWDPIHKSWLGFS